MKKSFEEKLSLVKNAIEKQLQNENVVASNEQITNISIAYMLVEQTMWFRLDDEKKISTLLTKFEDITGRALELLKVYHFEDLVYTFRKNYTNLYEVQGQGRKYNLSKKDYDEFIANIENGSLVVLTKPQKKRKAYVNNTVVQENKFIGNLVSKAPSTLIQVKKEQPKVVETPTIETPKKAQPKVVETPKTAPIVASKFLANLTTPKQPKVETKKHGGWVEHDKATYLEEKTFLKIKLTDNSNVFGRFEKIETSTDGKSVNIYVDVRGTMTSIDVVNIDKVYTYQR